MKMIIKSNSQASSKRKEYKNSIKNNNLIMNNIMMLSIIRALIHQLEEGHVVKLLLRMALI